MLILPKESPSLGKRARWHASQRIDQLPCKASNDKVVWRTTRSKELATPRRCAIIPVARGPSLRMGLEHARTTIRYRARAFPHGESDLSLEHLNLCYWWFVIVFQLHNSQLKCWWRDATRLLFQESWSPSGAATTLNVSLALPVAYLNDKAPQAHGVDR